MLEPLIYWEPLMRRLENVCLQNKQTKKPDPPLKKTQPTNQTKKKPSQSGSINTTHSNFYEDLRRKYLRPDRYTSNILILIISMPLGKFQPS